MILLASDIVCFSHGKDVEGLASASLVRMATGAEVVLVDYSDIMEKLGSLKDVKELYICDIGFNETLADPFIQELERITSFASIHYIDHHPLAENRKEKLIGLGVDVNHSLDESASVLTYMKFSGSLKVGANILASFGAVTDYMDHAPLAKKLISRFDRQFILLESTLLTFALLGCGDDYFFRNKIVIGLSDMKFPHEINDVLNYAQKGLEQISFLMKEVTEKGVKRTWMAIMEAKEGSTGILANLLVSTFNMPVGVSYRLIKDEDVYEVSLRGSYDSKFDLGDIVTQVAEMIGGVGGGHKKASGARIPRQSLNDFLDLIEFKMDMTTSPRCP